MQGFKSKSNPMIHNPLFEFGHLSGQFRMYLLGFTGMLLTRTS